jgi:hypothetical protein
MKRRIPAIECPEVYWASTFYFIACCKHTLYSIKVATNYLESPDIAPYNRLSVTGQLVPEAMVAYLDNHGPEKFATIFLGKPQY